MPDSKITALTSISTSTDPANDPLVIVDVSDTSMAATGTTKKVTTNQLLGAGGTATLASATITGDLTVDSGTLRVNSSNDRVGVGTNSPTSKLHVFGAGTNTFLRIGDVGANYNIDLGTQNADIAQLAVFNTTIASGSKDFWLTASSHTFNTWTGSAYSSRFVIASDGVCTWSNVGGVAGTAMTLNSTGLGVGGSPTGKLSLVGTGTYMLTINNTATDARIQLNSAGTEYGQISVGTDVINLVATGANTNMRFLTNGSEKMRLDPSGNVGIGVTPSAWLGFKALQVQYACFASNRFGAGNIQTFIGSNAFYDGSGYKYIVSDTAARYALNDNVHAWYNAPFGTAGSAITFTQAMTLDASGNLLVGKAATNYLTVGCELKPNGAFQSTQSGSTNANTCWDTYSTGAGAYRFYVGMAGTVFATNTTISAISDARFKENVQDIDVGLGAILALKPRKFDWKDGKGKNIKGDRGFIAQEFETVFPNLIDEWKENAPEGEAPYKSVRQDLIPVLVKAIQELAAEVNALKNA